MRVFITGGTGLIGRRLAAALRERGDRPLVLSRSADQARLKPALHGLEIVQGDPVVPGGWETRLDGCDAVVNLVGHNLFAERWSPEVKRRLHDSRVQATENLVAAIARTTSRPKVLVSSSAIGYYGPHGDEELTEDSPPGKDFMADLCRSWEHAAHGAEPLGLRLAVLRTGIVLAKDEGMLGALAPLFKYVPGGAAPIGSGRRPYAPGRGRQWMSWIHVEDMVGLVLLALDNANARGPMNGTSPRPERFYDFARALRKALGTWLPFVPWGPPDLFLKTVLGEVADVITKGQKVVPGRAQALGYAYRFPGLHEALADLYPRPAHARLPRFAFRR
jgi:uncharacterized protein (TIGR01777 family)